ncbi:hypothetical protein RRF57_012988 [Xylaria bambusicola]|uniref:Uncharacterized protein n=1 Tax=Xylaria bambusicola TaxID=326684 RepID=A0AAN7V2C6_9PEZI
MPENGCVRVLMAKYRQVADCCGPAVECRSTVSSAASSACPSGQETRDYAPRYSSGPGSLDYRFADAIAVYCSAIYAVINGRGSDT